MSLLLAAGLLAACVSEQRAVVTDPTLAALKADPMGTWTPDAFSSMVVKSGRPREQAGVTNPKPSLASWTRVFTSTPKSDPPVEVLADLTAAAEDDGWHIEYSGPADVAATKTVAGEPAVLYATITEPATAAIKPTDAYQLRLELQS